MLLTAVIMLVLPLLLLFVFDRGERATREWMGAGIDLDFEVLQLVSSEHFTLTRFGQYLRELSARFPGRRRRYVLPAAAGARTSCMPAR